MRDFDGSRESAGLDVTRRATGTATDPDSRLFRTYDTRDFVLHPFGWIKATAGLFQLKHRGLPKVDWVFTFASAAYNLIRLRRLVAAPA